MEVKERWFPACRIGFTYIGTVVGAGFASGQEIKQFFTVFGLGGVWGILVVTVLFSWLGTRMMLVGARLEAQSYEEFNNYLFGPRWGRWMNIFVGIVLFGVTTAMMSGTGAMFKEQLGMSFHLGVLLSSAIAYLVIIRGMEGILSVNSFVVPCMFLFTMLVAVDGLRSDGIVSFVEMEPVSEGSWMVSAITYAAFNLAMSQAVLVPIGGEIRDETTLRLGGGDRHPGGRHEVLFPRRDVGGNFHHVDRQCVRSGRQPGSVAPLPHKDGDRTDLRPRISVLPGRIPHVYQLRLPLLRLLRDARAPSARRPPLSLPLSRVR